MAGHGTADDERRIDPRPDLRGLGRGRPEDARVLLPAGLAGVLGRGAEAPQAGAHRCAQLPIGPRAIEAGVGIKNATLPRPAAHPDQAGPIEPAGPPAPAVERP